MFCVAWAQEQPGRNSSFVRNTPSTPTSHPYHLPMCNGPWCVHSDLCSKMPNPPISSSLLCISFTLHCSSSTGSVSVHCTGQQSPAKGCPIHPGSVNINHSLHAQPLDHALHFTDTYFTSVFHCSSVFHLRILFQFRISPPYFICSAGCSSYQGFTFWALNQQPVPGIALHRKPLYKADSRPKSRKC